MKLQDLRIGCLHDRPDEFKPNCFYISKDKINSYPNLADKAGVSSEDIWSALVKDGVAEKKKSYDDLVKSSKLKIEIVKDRNMNLNKSNLKVIKIDEETKIETVKVPQYKAAPKLEEKTYKIVKVTFASGHVQEAVCLPEDLDNYDLARGVELCILKEIFGGTKAYNDFLRKTMKDHKKRLEAEKKKQEDEKIADRRRAKNEKRKAESEAKKKEAERQEKIDIQAAAILKALQMYDELVVEQDFDEFMEQEINEWK